MLSAMERKPGLTEEQYESAKLTVEQPGLTVDLRDVGADVISADEPALVEMAVVAPDPPEDTLVVVAGVLAGRIFPTLEQKPWSPAIAE